MLLSHLIRLCISSASFIAASPLLAAPTVTSTSNSLPDTLQQTLPLCAQSCLQTSLVERFPLACTGQQSIECLCSHYSNVGESLGEVALGCIYSSCLTVDQSASAYNVCLGQKYAVMPTKTALTIVATSSPRTVSFAPSTSSTTTSRSIVTITSITTSTLRPQTRTSQSIFVDSVSALPSATAVVSSTPVPARVATDAPARLSPAQIAGLSVAAVAAFIMAIGLMVLSVCLRRRRERRFVMNGDEKSQFKREKKQSARFSHYVSFDSAPVPPSRFPLALPPTLRKGDKQAWQGQNFLKSQTAGLDTARPAQRLGVGTSNSSSNSPLPLDQIGLAISAELDGTSAIPKKTTTATTATSSQQQATSNTSQLNVPYRPFSTLTQNTVFEEDDVPARRRSSMLLPTPPVPIPPIRALQPSRPPPTFNVNSRVSPRRSELFLDIPIRHDRPQPKRIIAAEVPSNNPPKRTEPAPSRPRLAPPIQLISASSKSTTRTASSRDVNTAGDIIDYYFTSDRDPTPKASPARTMRPKESPRAVQIRSKKSLSTVSRTPSRSSTNIRDSTSSQTSFETLNSNDPTPEDEDSDKQLSSDDDKKQQLSPVAESPISNLRYPKVPRTSNQLVPRSPRSPRTHKSPAHPPKAARRPPEASALLSKRHHDLPPLLLESRPRINVTTPHNDPFTSPPRKPRGHTRSNSTESWTTTPASKVDRRSRVQSGAWGRSPIMYEPEVIKPLNVRRKRDEMTELNIGRDVDVDAEGMRSPVWVPRLTPTRKGDDLFISVGWGDGGR